MKYHPDGLIERYKARLVAQGFSQVHGVDYTETYTPTIRRESLRIFLAIATLLGMIILQMDVIDAYLESALSQGYHPIYMRIPQGCKISRDDLVCKILKSLYELKQAGRLWNKTLIKFFRTIGFIPTNGDPCILTYREGDVFIIVGVYVDDLALASQSEDGLNWLKAQLSQEFNMKDLGEAKAIIGWEITRDIQAGTLKIDQKGYIRDLLESESMSPYHPTILPVKAGSTLTLDQVDDHTPADMVAYQRLVGKLMYLACGTRPDIAFVVGQLSRHNSDPRIGHMRIAKQTLRYLKGTSTLGIVWGKDPAGHRNQEDKYGSFGVVGYADSSYAGDIDNRKSITGYCFFLGGAITTWCSKQQRTISTSTSEAEYVAMSHGAREGVWIRRFLNELLPKEAIRRIEMLGDNETSLTLTKDPESQNRTKHIDVMHHHVRELVENGELGIEWVPSSSMLADGLTKSLPVASFKRHRDEWGLEV